MSRIIREGEGEGTFAATPNELEALAKGFVAPPSRHVDRVLTVADHSAQP